MREKTTDERCREIQDRWAKATPGPWRAVENPNGYSGMTDIKGPDRVDTLATTAFHGWTPDERFANAEFIAHAVDDIGYLLSKLSEAYMLLNNRK